MSPGTRLRAVRRSGLPLQLAVIVAALGALAAHAAVTWSVLGSIDRVVLAVDAAFVLLAALAATVHLQQLARDRRRHALVQSLARSLSAPRDIEETAEVAARLLVEAGVASAVVVGVAQGRGELAIPEASDDALDLFDDPAPDDADIAPVARAGFPVSAPAVVNGERAASSFGRPSVLREITAGDAWIAPLGRSLGDRPVVARVPLRRGGELLGAMILVNGSAGALSDRTLLAGASTMIATALDNARLYQATLDQARDLESQDARRREFLYAISHELRTPLTSIRAFAELLTEERSNRRGRRPLADEEELLASLTRGVDRLSDLVEDLLQLGQAEAVDAHVELGLVEATESMRRAESMIRPSFMRRQQSLRTLTPPEPLWVWGDARTLEQVLINLLSNANRHTPEGGLVTASVTAGERYARFEVSDTGPGIPEAERARIFEPFYRVRHAGTSVPGSGLGLAIAARDVEALHGRIWVEESRSEDGSPGGARFCIEVPLTTTEQLAAAPAPQTLREAVEDATRSATQLHLELHQREES